MQIVGEVKLGLLFLLQSLKQHSLHEAVKYLTSTPGITATVRECVGSQIQPAKVSP